MPEYATPSRQLFTSSSSNITPQTTTNTNSIAQTGLPAAGDAQLALDTMAAAEAGMTDEQVATLASFGIRPSEMDVLAGQRIAAALTRLEGETGDDDGVLVEEDDFTMRIIEGINPETGLPERRLLFFDTDGTTLSGVAAGFDVREATTPSQAEVLQPEPEDCDATDFIANARSMFTALDSDGDGAIARDEIDAAMARADLNTEQAAAVATLRRFREDLAPLADGECVDTNNGVTLAALDDYERARDELWSTGDAPPGFRGILHADGIYNAGMRRNDNLNYDPTPGSPGHEAFPESSEDNAPRLDATGQGRVGSCSFLSAVGSIIAQGREGAIVDMIDTNPDGSYTVYFPEQAPITLTAPTKADIAYGATAGSNGIWLTVLEKAYAQLRDSDDNPTLNIDAAQGSTSEAIETLTGYKAEAFDTSPTSSSPTAVMLEEAMASQLAVSASLLGHSVEGMPGDHAYTVIGYDPSTETITLHNPWGAGRKGERKDGDKKPVDGVDDGIFTISVEDFDILFTDITIETTDLR